MVNQQCLSPPLHPSRFLLTRCLLNLYRQLNSQPPLMFLICESLVSTSKPCSQCSLEDHVLSFSHLASTFLSSGQLRRQDGPAVQCEAHYLTIFSCAATVSVGIELTMLNKPVVCWLETEKLLCPPCFRHSDNSFPSDQHLETLLRHCWDTAERTCYVLTCFMSDINGAVQKTWK